MPMWVTSKEVFKIQQTQPGQVFLHVKMAPAVTGSKKDVVVIFIQGWGYRSPGPAKREGRRTEARITDRTEDTN